MKRIAQPLLSPQSASTKGATVIVFPFLVAVIFVFLPCMMYCGYAAVMVD
jgi:hypothetical protein